MELERPFDARLVLMSEDPLKPPEEWRTVSLVTGLRGIVVPSSRLKVVELKDPKARLEAARAQAGALTRRGLDADSLIRYGLAHEVAAGLAALLFTRQTTSDPRRVSPPGLNAESLEAWSRLLAIPPSRKEKPSVSRVEHIVMDLATRVAPRVESWISQASFEDIVTLRAPSSEELGAAMSLDPADWKIRAEYKWLVDRFSETFYSDWQRNSMILEYRWHCGNHADPCSRKLMDDRGVIEGKLTAEIARTAELEELRPQGDIDFGHLLIHELENHAVSLLAEGRHEEAAVLFEFAIQRQPNDSAAHNNLGFCLIPRDPERALLNLEVAARLGYKPTSINSYNRICCHVALREYRDAFDLAEEQWEHLGGSEGRMATLWSHEADGSWALLESVQVRHQLVRLMVFTAQTQGLTASEVRWRERESTLPR